MSKVFMKTKELKKFKDIIDRTVTPGSLTQVESYEIFAPMRSFLSEHTPKELYRFRSCTDDSIDALDKNEMFFSPGTQMNDDFDGMLYYNKRTIQAWAKDVSLCYQPFISLLTAIKEGYDVPNVYDGLFSAAELVFLRSALAQYQLSVIEATSGQVYSYLINTFDSVLTKLRNMIQNTKIACFSEDIKSTAMWGHYADSSKGFAVSYDFRNGNYSNCSFCYMNNSCPDHKSVYTVPVIYGEDRFDGTEYLKWGFQYLLVNSTLTQLGLEPSFFCSKQNALCPDTFAPTKAALYKSSAWRYEREWRMIFTCRSNQINQQEHPSVNKTPTAIYLGRKIKSIHEKIILGIATNKNIPVYKMNIREGNKSYKLYPKLIYEPTLT